MPQSFPDFFFYFNFFQLNSIEISNSCKMGVRWKSLQSKGINFFEEKRCVFFCFGGGVGVLVWFGFFFLFISLSLFFLSFSA